MRLTWSPNITAVVERLATRLRWAGVMSDAARRKRHLATEISIVQGSSLFDREWYLRTYPDIAQAGRDPLVHYLEIGWQEGRDPGPHFGTSAYLKANVDVARSAINPLVHFIEFGRAEGRGSFDPHPHPANSRKTSFDFPVAAPCASFAIHNDAPVRWLASYRLNSQREDAVMCGHRVAGYAPDVESRTTFRLALALLAEISGFAVGNGPAQFGPGANSSEEPADSWYVNVSQLRTRWKSHNYPFVVRAFQCDPFRAGEFSLVGEGRVASALDVMDVNLRNRFFPVLFAFAEPAGCLRGSRLLAFPSLCRGGLHYAELLSGPEEDRAIDPFARSDRICADMLKLRRLEATPAVSTIAVDLDKADGTGPLFQPDFQDWLRRIAQVSVMPSSATVARTEAFLARSVRVAALNDEARGGGTLFLRHDAVPTIAALTATRDQEGRAGEGTLHLLVAGHEPFQPVISIQIPDGLPGSSRKQSSAQVVWQRDADAGCRKKVPPSAIKLARTKGLTDSELFIPAMDDYDGSIAHRGAVMWLIDPRGWEQHLGDAISCIVRQAGGGADIVAFTRRPNPAEAAVIKDADGNVRVFKDLETAVAEASTPLAAFVGPNVLLHDRLTAAHFARILEDKAISTASCVIVSVEKAGTAWHASILDQGAIRMGPELAHQAQDRTLVAEHMWRMDYPVLEPSPYLWCTRSSLLAEWVKGGSAQSPAALHVCSARVTASHVGRGEPGPSPAFIPRAADDMATRAELLFG